MAGWDPKPNSTDFESVSDLWLKYNDFANRLTAALGRTSNLVGEYAEHLTLQHYGGALLPASSCSADLRAEDGTTCQVKARKILGVMTTQLGVIRSWDFDFLVTVLFDDSGRVIRALETPVEIAKEHGVHNSHQNGWVITTNRRFLDDPRSRDITAALRSLQ